MTRNVLLLAAATVCAWAQAPPWWSVSMPHVEGIQPGPVIGKPLSGKETRRATQTLNDGTPVDRSDTSYFYRDGAGRMREQSPDKVEIFDPSNHIEYDLDPEKKTYRKLQLPINISITSLAVATVAPGDPAGVAIESASWTEDLGRQMVNGLMAKGSRVTVALPAGFFGNSRKIMIVNERWYSEDLQALVKSSNNDPRFGLNVYDLTNIDQSAPKPSLFEPPSDYVLVTR